MDKRDPLLSVKTESRPSKVPTSHLIHDEAAWAFNQEIQKKTPRLQSVPTKDLRATQTWIGKGSPSAPVYAEYADHPVGVRDKAGKVHLLDGHHRADNAVGEGRPKLKVHVIDSDDQVMKGGLRSYQENFGNILNNKK